jgi:hypothetical protein
VENETLLDAAYIILNIPVSMLNEYSKISGINKNLPDGQIFGKQQNRQT